MDFALCTTLPTPVSPCGLVHYGVVMVERFACFVLHIISKKKLCQILCTVEIKYLSVCLSPRKGEFCEESRRGQCWGKTEG